MRCSTPRSFYMFARPGFKTRREWLRDASQGFGMLALSALAASDGRLSGLALANPAPKVKNVIFCFMDGGPSHVDTFDPKPELAKRQGQEIGMANINTRAQSRADRVWLGSPW